MGSALSKAPTRKYPSAAARGGVEKLLTTPRSSKKQDLDARYETSQNDVTRNNAGNVENITESHSTATNGQIDQTSKNNRLDDDVLGLRDFESGNVPGYHVQLNEMLKKIGPVQSSNNLLSKNNIQFNPVGEMFKMKEIISQRGLAESRDMSLKRTLLSPSQLSEILENMEKGWSKEEIKRAFFLDEGILEKIGTGFKKFHPKVIDAPKLEQIDQVREVNPSNRSFALGDSPEQAAKRSYGHLNPIGKSVSKL
ncbi:hypothetical protein V1511DRAFT_503676 [Dipodascopsis uninucleata]